MSTPGSLTLLGLASCGAVAVGVGLALLLSGGGRHDGVATSEAAQRQTARSINQVAVPQSARPSALSDPESANARWNGVVPSGDRWVYHELVAAARDDRLDQRVRNYAVQHLGLWYQRHGTGFEELLDLAAPGSDPAVRDIATYTLARVARSDRRRYDRVAALMLAAITDGAPTAVAEAGWRGLVLLGICPPDEDFQRAIAREEPHLQIAAIDAAVALADNALQRQLQRALWREAGLQPEGAPLRQAYDRLAEQARIAAARD